MSWNGYRISASSPPLPHHPSAICPFQHLGCFHAFCLGIVSLRFALTALHTGMEHGRKPPAKIMTILHMLREYWKFYFLFCWVKKFFLFFYIMKFNRFSPFLNILLWPQSYFFLSCSTATFQLGKYESMTIYLNKPSH